MDTLKLNGIEVECVLGDLPEERTREQRIQVDVSLEMDLESAGESDSIEDTVTVRKFGSVPGLANAAVTIVRPVR